MRIKLHLLGNHDWSFPDRQIFSLGHTNLFNCFTESPPKISENGKKKNWNFENFIFSAVVDLFISKFKKNENCFFLTVPMQETVITFVVSTTDTLRSVWHKLTCSQVTTSGVKNSWQIRADTVHAMVLLMCHTHYTPTQPETPGLIDNTIAK